MNTHPTTLPAAPQRVRVAAAVRVTPKPPRARPASLHGALPADEVVQDLKARPVLTLQEYLRQFTDAQGNLIVEDSLAQLMIADGRLPAYKSAGVWLVRAAEPLPVKGKGAERREAMAAPEYVTLIEWGTALIAAQTYPSAQDREHALSQARTTVHDWRKRGRINPGDLYQSRSNYLIRRDAALLPPEPAQPRRRR